MLVDGVYNCWLCLYFALIIVVFRCHCLYTSCSLFWKEESLVSCCIYGHNFPNQTFLIMHYPILASGNEMNPEPFMLCVVRSADNILASSKNRAVLMISQDVWSFIVCWGQLAKVVVDCCWDNEPGRDNVGTPTVPYVNESTLWLNLLPLAVRRMLNSWCDEFTWKTIYLASKPLPVG